MFSPFCDLPAGFHILTFRILNPWEIWTFSIFEDFESWGFFNPKVFWLWGFQCLSYGKSPQFLMLLWNQILTRVLFVFNFRYYDNHFLVCGTRWIKNIWFFSFVFAAPPVISRRSHTLRRRAVGQIFPHGQELWSQGGKFDSLWTSVVGEELLPGRGTWLQSEWMSTSQVLEFAAGTVEKYLYTTWFAIPLPIPLQFRNT